jgi:hypothetical protein
VSTCFTGKAPDPLIRKPELNRTELMPTDDQRAAAYQSLPPELQADATLVLALAEVLCPGSSVDAAMLPAAELVASYRVRERARLNAGVDTDG